MTAETSSSEEEEDSQTGAPKAAATTQKPAVTKKKEESSEEESEEEEEEEDDDEAAECLKAAEESLHKAAADWRRDIGGDEVELTWGTEDGRKSPAIPPPTYMWEDIRRSFAKGGYPWTHYYKGSLDSTVWHTCFLSSRPLTVDVSREHEYEPITPREEMMALGSSAAAVVRPRSPMPQLETERAEAEIRRERRFIRIPQSDQVIIPLHGSSDEEHNPDRYEDSGLVGMETLGGPGSFPEPIRCSPSPRPRRVDKEARLTRRLRSTAANVGTKIRSISLPDRSRIKMPETPKFLTEKPKFLTEKPKFLTEKPKFLTEKPKFLTEKPKFLTEKPKFLTEKPKFLTEKPKFLTETPKFLKERPRIRLPDRSKFKIPERAKLNMDRFKVSRKTVRQSTVSTVTSEYGSEKNIFDTIKAKTYPRFLARKKKGVKKTPEPPPTKFDSESLPSTPQSKRKDKWTDVYKGRKYTGSSTERNGESFQERYSKREAKRASSSSLNSDKEQASSGSSTQRHRAGVIEEIDSDEFFVRVKGISREDVDVSRYLTTEIREAFRSPKNALASLDMDDMDVDTPERPDRAPKEYPRQEFNTFPTRPNRRKSGSRERVEKPPRRFRSKSGQRSKQSSVPNLAAVDGHDYDLDAAAQLPPQAPKRRKSTKDVNEEWQVEPDVVPTQMAAQESMQKAGYDSPVAPFRKTRSQGTSLADEDRTSRGAESLRSEIHMDDELMDEEFQQEEEKKRLERSYEDDMKHGYDLVDEAPPPKRPDRSRSREKGPGYATVNKSKPSRPPPPRKQAVQRQLQTWKTQGVNFFLTYPRRAIKSLNKMPKRPVRNYSTIAGPTRPPRRHKVFREPVYVEDIDQDVIPYADEVESIKETSSLKTTGEKMIGRPLPPPPRPPRKTKDDEEDLNDLDLKDAEEFVDEGIVESVVTSSIIVATHEREVVQKTASPAPSPRPSRPDRKPSYSSLKEPTEKATTTRPTSEMSQQTSFEVAEITVSVQTDPLPEGYIVADLDSQPPRAEPEDEEPSIEKYLEKYGEEIKKLESQITKSKSSSLQRETKPEQMREFQDEEEPKPVESRKVEELRRTEVKEERIEPQEVRRPQVKEERIEPQEVRRPQVKEERIEPQEARRAEVREEIKQDNFRSREAEEPKAVKDKMEGILPERKKKDEKEKKRDEDQDEPKPPRDAPRVKETKTIELAPSDKLHLTQLDVDNLNVHSLKASQILVSDLTGQSLQVTELTSRGGNLVVGGLELPQDFIQSLASEIQSRVEAITPQPQKLTMVQVQAPPPIVVQPSAEIVQPPTPEVPSASDNLPKPRSTRSKGRKSPTRIIDDSEDELATTMPQRRSPSPAPEEPKKPEPKSEEPAAVPPPPAQVVHVSTLPAQPTASQLLVQLLNIWQGYLIEGFSSCYNSFNNLFPEGDKRRDAQTAAVILFVLILGLIAMGFGTDNTVHHHHWDFVPPRV